MTALDNRLHTHRGPAATAAERPALLAGDASYVLAVEVLRGAEVMVGREH